MCVLLDESEPRQLAAHLPGHEVSTVPRAGWAGLKNGELLSRASTELDAFVTGDQGIEFQQAYTRLPLAIIVIAARNNRVETIIGLAGSILKALDGVEPGELVRVGE